MRHRTIACLTLLALFAALMAASSVASAAPRPKQELDWNAWRSLPVYHNGRIMPLDTFARSAAEIISNRENPTYSLKESMPDKELSRPGLADARQLFPDDEPRRFEAAQLLFSWLVEPEKWEEVPFLIAEHEDLRKLLDVPVTDPETGNHLKYVSPAQVQDADAFYQRLVELSDEQRAVDAAGKTFELKGLDKKIDELFQAFRLYRQLTLDPTIDPSARTKFQSEFQRVAKLWQQDLAGNLQLFDAAGRETGLGDSVSKARTAIEQLGGLSQQPSLDLVQANAATEELLQASEVIAEEFDNYHQRISEAPPESMEPEQVEKFKTVIKQLAVKTRLLNQLAGQMQTAMYDNGEWLRVVPALSAAALEKDRTPEEKSQPWLDLQTLLLAPQQVLKGYPPQKVEDVRKAFARIKETYLAQPDNAPEFALRMRWLQDSLRELGESIEDDRRDLKNADPAMLAYTAYPPAAHTKAELRYNTLDPFQWSWMISFVALGCFCLSFGVLRKPMFWVGMAVLGVCIICTIYGFYLRVSVTRWAPVTNMYETVVYVPLVVALLGAWFALLPLLWPGVQKAWRMTGVPGSFELPATASNNMQAYLPNFLFLLPRLALTGLIFWMLAWAPYAAGGRSALNLLPTRDVGSSLPGGNDLLTWTVGMCVLIAACLFVPRAILTAVISLVTVPRSLPSAFGTMVSQVYPRKPFVLAATGVATLGWVVAWYAPILDSSFTPLQPVLRDNFWLTIHVLTIVASYAAGALAWGLGNIALFYYLFGRYRPALEHSSLSEQHRPVGDVVVTAGKRPPEECATLAAFIYRAVQVAVLLLAAGTILGGLWADVSWGRFWGWDPKEVWALISLLTYLAILHGRYAGLFGNFGLAVGSVLGASAIIFSWYGVNFYLGAGLHSYGFGAGGQGEVSAAVALNWVFLTAATIRYLVETWTPNSAPPPGPDGAAEEAVVLEAPA